MDRLDALLARFHLTAQVFQKGALCRSARYRAADGRGYLHVLRAGRLRLETAGERAREIGEPSVLLYMNPTSHRLVPLDGPADLVCASFDCGVAHGNPLGAALPGVVVLPLARAPALEAATGLLFREADEEHCGRQAVLDRLSEVVLIHLLRDLMDEGRLSVGLLAALSDARLARAINAIHAEPARAWSLDALAAAAGMSRARFAVHFRDAVGQTPGAYLADWRLALARALLLEGRPVKQIADEVGYGNASALSRAFSARLGRSPRQWLREHSGERAAGAARAPGRARAKATG